MRLVTEIPSLDAASGYIHIRLVAMRLQRALRMGLGLNETTVRELNAMGSPVRGLRPRRARLRLTTKVPKPLSLTFSPCLRLSLTVAKTVSTITSASFFE